MFFSLAHTKCSIELRIDVLVVTCETVWVLHESAKIYSNAQRGREKSKVGEIAVKDR